MRHPAPVALSAVYAIPSYKHWDWTRRLTANWQLSAVYQVQSGFPFTISVFGDTANAGTLLGESPIRANYTGQPVFGSGTHNAQQWFSPAAFAVPAAYTFGDAGRNTVYGPSLQTADVAIVRDFVLTEHWRFQIAVNCSTRSIMIESRHAESLCKYAAVRHHY